MADTEISTILYENMRKLMKLGNMSYLDVARSIGIAERTLREWFTKGYIPPLVYCCKLADRFAVPLDYLIGRYTMESAKEIEETYPSVIKQIKRDAYETYLTVGDKKAIRSSNVIPPYPYNLLGDIFEKRWMSQVNPMQESGLKLALNTLTEREKKCITEYYENGQTQKEIAEMVPTGESSVSKILSTAIGKLRFSHTKKLILNGYDEYITPYTDALTKRMITLESTEKSVSEIESRMDALCKEIRSCVSATANTLKKMQKHISPEIQRYQGIYLASIGLSARTTNLLLSHSILTVGDLMEYDGSLQDLYGFGPSTIEEIKEQVKKATGVRLNNI